MNYRLNQTKKRFLVAIHVIAVASWVGGTLGMLALGIYLQHAANGEQLYYTLLSMEVIDENLLKYPALLSLITGILLSIWTHWGLIKHVWVLVKLVLTVTTIMIGILFLNKWTAHLVEVTKNIGILSLQHQDFQTTWMSILLTASFNLFCLLLMIFLTYYKPFGKIKRKKATK